LRGVILLPRTTLPLSVFEPRYLQLVDDVIAGNRLIGIVQPAMEAGDGESPRGMDFGLRSVGCIGRITAFSETDDNQYMITLTGIARFDVVDDQTSDTPYRLCKADVKRFADDIERGEGEDNVDRKRLRAVLKSYLEANELTADWESIDRSSNELLVNTLSVISPYGPEEKQALLEALDLKRRAEVLVALAEMDLAARDDGSGTSVQ
jgi:Lon protease-like protein